MAFKTTTQHISGKSEIIIIFQAIKVWNHFFF